jgi:uncharacterized protein
MIALATHENGLVVSVRAQPGAKRNGVMGEHAGALKVAVTAAPEKGKANAAIMQVLAEALGCKPSQIEILSGTSGREKKVLISGIVPEDLKMRIEALLEVS